MKHIAALWLLVVAVASNAGQPIFSSLTEDSAAGGAWFKPSSKLAAAVLASVDVDQREQIREHLAENNIKGARNLLAATKVSLCRSCKEAYLFLRPASNQYSPWYGAHSYTYWLVTPSGKVMHSAAVDSFDLLDDSGTTLRPIEQSMCLTSKCFVTRLEYNGKGYTPVSCRTHDVANDQWENGCGQP